MEIFVREAPGAAPRGHGMLVDAVARVAGVDPGEVLLGTRCARCGSADHGKPAVERPLGPGGAPFQASLSRTGGLTVVAVSTDAPVGVDIERAAEIARAPIDAALHPAERRSLAALAPRDRAHRLAVLWTAKEAVLKAAGVGLNIEPSLLELRVRGRMVEVASSPASLALPAATTISLFEPADGVVGAVVVLGGAPTAGEPRLVRLPES